MQLGIKASLGAGAEFSGTVLAAISIALGASAKVNGRLLVQTAVTLDANEVQP